MNRLQYHTNTLHDLTPVPVGDFANLNDQPPNESMIMSLISLTALILVIAITNIYRGLVFLICSISSFLLRFVQNPITVITDSQIHSHSMMTIRPRMSPIKRRAKSVKRKTKELMAPLPRSIANQPQPLFSFLFSNILPNRAASRLMKPLTHKVCPKKWRAFMLRYVFGSLYSVRWHEIQPDLSKYRTFHDFFTRKLCVDRKMSKSDLVSPVDGTVVSFGEMDESQTIEQVKGVRFGLKQFLYGFDTEFNNEKMRDLQRDINPGNKLFYSIMYLAPGDYHRFHCPADNVKIDCINHIVGDLYPVKPSYLNTIPGLFSLNERMVLSGKWTIKGEDRFFAYAPVGAFNIGSIHLRDDPYHVTNQISHDSEIWYRNQQAQGLLDEAMDDHKENEDVAMLKEDRARQCHGEWAEMKGKKCISVFKPGQELVYNKGNEIGHFSFGSTVVLVFEAPNIEWAIERGQKVLFGQPLGDITSC